MGSIGTTTPTPLALVKPVIKPVNNPINIMTRIENSKYAPGRHKPGDYPPNIKKGCSTVLQIKISNEFPPPPSHRGDILFNNYPTLLPYLGLTAPKITG